MRTNSLVSLSGALAVAFVATVTAEDVSSSTANECRILKQESNLCPSDQYLTNIKNIVYAESRLQKHLDRVSSSLRIPADVQEILPARWSVRDHVIKTCHKSIRDMRATSSQQTNSSDPVLLTHMLVEFFLGPKLESSWASSSSIREPDCVSFHDRGLGHPPIDNAVVVNDLKSNNPEGQAQDHAGEERWLKIQSLAELNADQGGLFEFHSEEDGAGSKTEQSRDDVVKATLKTRHLSRRKRIKHHHHHHHHHYPQQHQQKHPPKHHHQHEKRGAHEPQKASPGAEVAIRADVPPGQSVYTVGGQANASNGDEEMLLHKSLSHARTNMEDDQQKALIQGGSNLVDPVATTEALGKASTGQPSEKPNEDEAAADSQDKAGGSHDETLWLAAAPILLLMGAIVGFTVYRRFYESKGDNDSSDYRDLSIRQGSPIHFDRTLQNADHPFRPEATYHFDPEGSSCIRHPSSTASMATKRPPPLAGSLGKQRYQILSRSYDLRAGIQSIKNALTLSNNNSHDGALNRASGHSGLNSSFQTSMGVDHAFGAGGHPIAKIASHPGLNVLEKHHVQRQYNAGSVGSMCSKFPDRNKISVPQEHSIVWGYSAEDNQTRKSPLSSLLSMQSGKYYHRHQQPLRQRYDIENIDYLSPESPFTMREEETRRRNLITEGYSFRREEFIGDDYSCANRLFDTGDGSGSEIVHDTDLCDDEVNMYLSMEKEESPEMMDVLFKSDDPIHPKVSNTE